jgi:pimeloyl-ACP methyl ester carboxylesterase
VAGLSGGNVPVPILFAVTRGRFKRLLFRVSIAMTPLTARIGAAYLAMTARYLRGWMIPRFIDPHVLARAASRDVWRRSIQESVRHGGRGVAHEYVLFAKPWGFELRDITEHVLLWHGEADVIVPVDAARAAAAELRSCEATFFAGAGHLMFVEHAAEIVSTIAAAVRAEASGVAGADAI